MPKHHELQFFADNKTRDPTWMKVFVRPISRCYYHPNQRQA